MLYCGGNVGATHKDSSDVGMMVLVAVGLVSATSGLTEGKGYHNKDNPFLEKHKVENLWNSNLP